MFSVDPNFHEYASEIVPLARVVNTNYSQIMDALPTGNEATVIALRAILTTWNAIWHTPNDAWRRIRSKINLGLIKETKCYGNTSVSMGCAKKYFDANPEETVIGFINCGGGGNKYQLYKKEDNIISVVYEYKPKNGSSPSRANVAGFTSGDNELKNSENDSMLSIEIEEFRIQVSRKVFISSFPILAFITGKFRGFWEKQSTTVKSEMNAWAVEHFGQASETIKPGFGETFCLKQDDEGDLEAIGTTCMYRQLALGLAIPHGTRVIGINGIGQSSVQLLSQSPDEKENVRFNYSPGMSKPDQLELLPLSAVPELRKQLPDIIRWAEECDEPVIALKSGCMLFLGTPTGADVLKLFKYDCAATIAEGTLQGILAMIQDYHPHLTFKDSATQKQFAIREITSAPYENEKVVVHAQAADTKVVYADTDSVMIMPTKQLPSEKVD